MNDLEKYYHDIKLSKIHEDIEDVIKQSISLKLDDYTPVFEAVKELVKEIYNVDIKIIIAEESINIYALNTKILTVNSDCYLSNSDEFIYCNF